MAEEQNEKKTKYFPFFDSYLEATAELSDTEFANLFRAVAKYHATKEIPDLTGPERVIFPFIKGDVDRMDERYAERCRKNAQNRQAALARKQAQQDDGQQSSTIVNDGQQSSTIVNDGQQSSTIVTNEKEKVKEKVNVRVKEKVKEKVNAKVNENILYKGDSPATEPDPPRKPAAKKNPFSESLDSLFQIDPNLCSIAAEWVKYYEEKIGKIGATEGKRLFNRIKSETEKHGAVEVTAVIKESMDRQWKSIAWNMLDQKKPPGTSSWSQSYTDEDYKEGIDEFIPPF